MPFIFEDGAFQPCQIQKQQFSDILVPLLIANIAKKEREWYILPRSTHWVEDKRNEGELDAADDDQDFSTRDILLQHSQWLIIYG